MQEPDNSNKKGLSRRKMLRRFLYIITLLLIYILLYEYSYSSDKKEEVQTYVEDINAYRNTLTLSDENIAISWCKFFIEKDYITCDNLSSSGDKKLSAYMETDYAYKSNASGEIYTKMLDKLGENITSVALKSATDHIGYIQYFLEIEYYKYDVATPIVINQDEYKTLCEAYIANEISDNEYAEGVSELYLESFDLLFVVTDKTLYKEVVQLSVKKIEGLDYVYGTGALILKMYNVENIETLLALYESNVSKEINKSMITY